MTLEDLKNLDELHITPQQASEVIGCRAQCLREQAKTNPQALGFNVCVIGDVVRIPRKPFIEFWERLK